MPYSTSPIAEPRPAVAPEPESARHHDKTALVVDDDSLVRGLLGEMLRRLGFGAVLKAGSVAEAEELGGLGTVDLCIVDWKLPGIDGMEFLHRLRGGALALRPTIGAVLITGLADQEAVLMARELGADAVIAKPFSRQAVASAVERALQTTRF